MSIDKERKGSWRNGEERKFRYILNITKKSSVEREGNKNGIECYSNFLIEMEYFDRTYSRSYTRPYSNPYNIPEEPLKYSYPTGYCGTNRTSTSLFYFFIFDHEIVEWVSVSLGVSV